MKNWYESKTMWVNIITGLVGTISLVTSSIPMSENASAILAIIIGTVNSALRLVTDSPIGSREA